EAATAGAAAALGLGHCLSTFSSADAGEVAEASAEAGGGLRWRQIYVLRDRGLTRSLVEEAEEFGYRALVCTVDVPTVGRRNRDRANGFDRFAVAPPAILKNPEFLRVSSSVVGGPKDALDSVFPNRQCGWDDIEDIASSTSLPVLVKGVLDPN